MVENRPIRTQLVEIRHINFLTADLHPNVGISLVFSIKERNGGIVGGNFSPFPVPFQSVT